MSQEQKTNWQPSASLNAIQARANLYAQIRKFFAHKDILEVETPLLGKSNSLDINLHPFVVNPQRQSLLLQTSPEFFMKRLLAAGTGSIYQICKAFRDEEHGRLHNPEFSMLEWYRVGFSLNELIQEVDELLHLLLQTAPAKQKTYEEIFAPFHLNPHLDSDEDCVGVALAQGAPVGLSREQSCDYLFDLGLNRLDDATLWVVTEFPVWQAALAKTQTKNSHQVARRFEFYYKGLELANGYDELNCKQEQHRRFNQENEQRRMMAKPILPICHKFLEALANMPDCCGVAVGLDRVLMLKQGHQAIEEVLAFGYEYL